QVGSALGHHGVAVPAAGIVDRPVAIPGPRPRTNRVGAAVVGSVVAAPRRVKGHPVGAVADQVPQAQIEGRGVGDDISRIWSGGLGDATRGGFRSAAGPVSADPVWAQRRGIDRRLVVVAY